MAVSAPESRLSLLVVLTAILTLSLVLLPSAAHAEDDEGGSAALSAKLEESAKAYYDIQARLTASQKRQADIRKKLQAAELSLVRLSGEVAEIAAARYKSGQMGVLNGFLFGRADTTEEVLQGAAVAEYLTWRDDEQLRQYREARDEADRQRALLDAEVAIEQKQVKELDKQKRNAEKALAGAGGMVSAGYDGPVPKSAQPAPRNADGSFPRESCSVNDPTTGGCITPRTFHAVNEARLAKFNRAVYCWRTQSWGEHPKGRACDFSLKSTGFGGIATSGEKAYGTKLAQYFIKNADALGVLYVIWYRQIWMPGIGWRSYFGSGSPSSEHTNHVHLSML